MVRSSKNTRVPTLVQENFFVYWEKSIKWYQYLYIYTKSKIVVRPSGPSGPKSTKNDFFDFSGARSFAKGWWQHFLMWIRWIIAVLLRNGENGIFRSPAHLSGPHSGSQKWIKFVRATNFFQCIPVATYFNL